jgi:hypothetical protein
MFPKCSVAIFSKGNGKLTKPVIQVIWTMLAQLASGGFELLVAGIFHY